MYLGGIDGQVASHESGSVVCIPRIEPTPRHPNVNLLISTFECQHLNPNVNVRSAISSRPGGNPGANGWFL